MWLTVTPFDQDRVVLLGCHRLNPFDNFHIRNIVTLVRRDDDCNQMAGSRCRFGRSIVDKGSFFADAGDITVCSQLGQRFADGDQADLILLRVFFLAF